MRFAAVLLRLADGGLGDHNLATAFLRLQRGSIKQSLSWSDITDDKMEVKRKDVNVAETCQ